MAGDDQSGGQREQAGPGLVKHHLILGEGVRGRAEAGPPQVRAGDQAAVGGRQRGDVLAGMAGGRHQPDRTRRLSGGRP